MNGPKFDISNMENCVALTRDRMLSHETSLRDVDRSTGGANAAWPSPTPLQIKLHVCR